MTKKKMTIDELEKILANEEEAHITILANGEIRSRKGKKKPKVITMRENLGGEYGQAA